MPYIVKFSDGLGSLKKNWYDKKAMSSNLAFIKNKFSLHKFSCFISANDDSKGSKNSEYSIDLSFTWILIPMHKMVS